MATTTWNPSDKTASLTLSGGNLIATAGSSSQGARAVDKQITGKFYFEVTETTWGNGDWIGLGTAGSTFTSSSTGTVCLVAGASGLIFINGSSTGIGLGATANGNVICIAVDIGAELIWFRIGSAGNWNGNASYNPATGAGGISISSVGGVAFPLYPMCFIFANTRTLTANFGASAFTGAVPSGFTSGFTSGASPAVNAIATQAALEEFGSTNPQAQVTQVSLEEWMAATSVGVLATVTQVALEEWASASSLIGIHFALADATDAAAFTVSTVTDHISFALTDAHDTAAVSLIATTHRSLSFALNDALDTAVFAVKHGASLSFALTDAHDAAAVTVVSGHWLSFTLHDAVDIAAFTLFQTWAPQATLFPRFSGIGWPVHRRPNWRTIIISHPSGGERRMPLWTYPLWEFELTFDLSASPTQFIGLGETSYQELLGFYLAQSGQLATFRFQDPDFNAQIGGPCGTGDGTTVDFLFMRKIGGTAGYPVSSVEPASWVTGTPTVYLDAAVQPASTWQLVPPNNLVFLSPPAAGAAITADFDYEFLCRFGEDTGDYEQQMINLWDIKSLKFRQVRNT